MYLFCYAAFEHSTMSKTYRTSSGDAAASFPGTMSFGVDVVTEQREQPADALPRTSLKLGHRRPRRKGRLERLRRGRLHRRAVRRLRLLDLRPRHVFRLVRNDEIRRRLVAERVAGHATPQADLAKVFRGQDRVAVVRDPLGHADPRARFDGAV